MSSIFYCEGMLLINDLQFEFSSTENWEFTWMASFS